MPEPSFWGIHPATCALIVAYIYGMRMVSQTHKSPMWHPRWTRETRPADHSEKRRHAEALWKLWASFALSAAFVALAGWILARAGPSLSRHTGLSETVVGGFFTGLASSLPELITAVTAVRLGALTLAVGDVLGGNAFDTLILGISVMAHRQGSIYAALSRHQLFLLGLTTLLTGILLLGLLYREKHGIANIVLESLLVITLYLGAFAALILSG